MVIKAIIWDLGNVLIDWNPKYVFDKLFDDKEKQHHFLSNICNLEWNEEQDAGRSIKEGTELLLQKHPEWKEYILAYYEKWEEMLAGPIDEVVSIFEQLKKGGHFKMYALTNWSAETFPKALEKYEFLHWFDGRVVSGEEKMRKPAREIYQIVLDRYHLKAAETLFIDDNLRNVNAAVEMGIPTIHFKSAVQLKNELNDRKIL